MRTCLALLQNIGLGEILILAIVGVLLFGSSLPEVAGNAARTIRKWRDAWRDATADFRQELLQEEKTSTPAPQPSASLPCTTEPNSKSAPDTDFNSNSEIG